MPCSSCDEPTALNSSYRITRLRIKILAYFHKYNIDSDSVTVYNGIMLENEQTYTIEELAEQVGTPVRTIRFYIAEGLLSGPGTRGKAASYSGEHLLRLRLIRRL